MSVHGVELHATFNIIHTKKMQKYTVFKVRVTSSYEKKHLYVFYQVVHSIREQQQCQSSTTNMQYALVQ